MCLRQFVQLNSEERLLRAPNFSRDADKDGKKSPFYFYVLSNYKENTNKQSAIEVEVWEWNESDGIVENKKDTPRLHIKDFVQSSDGKKGEEGFYAYDKTKVPDFWSKSPNFFTVSSDDPHRLIFAANSRANHVFDLKMENGCLLTYPKELRD